MLLTEVFSTWEDDSYAKSTSTSSIAESQRIIAKKTSEKNTIAMGLLGESNKKPTGQNLVTEGEEMSHILQARQLVKQALRDPSQRHEYFDFLNYLRGRYGKEYSTRIHQDATKIDNIASTKE